MAHPENKVIHLNNNKIDVKIIHKELTKNNKTILKSQQRFRSETYNVFTDEINKIASSSNDD